MTNISLVKALTLVSKLQSTPAWILIFYHFNQADLKEYLKDRKGEKYFEEEISVSDKRK